MGGINSTHVKGEKCTLNLVGITEDKIFTSET
jgi:hypothetical protein